MKLSEIVGFNISSKRKSLGMSQKELAARLNITQDALNRMEKGRIAPKMTRLDELASHLQCPVASLFRQEDEATQERAFAIAEILSTLPEAGQSALVNLVEEAAKVMNTKK